MKLLLIIIILLPSFLYAGTRCYIINESKIEYRTSPMSGALNEVCPKGLSDIKDLTYVPGPLTACSGSDDCYSKFEGLCQPDIETDYGRPLVNGDFTQVYCVKPVLDTGKRTARLAQELVGRSSRETAQGLRDTRFNQIKAQCVSANGLLKLICQHISGE